MKKGMKIVLTAVICIVAVAVVLKLYGVEIRVNPAYEGAVAVMCDGVAYEQEDGEGWLTIRCVSSRYNFQRPVVQVRVEDGGLQEELSGRDVEELIGVQIGFSVPQEVWDQSHVQGSRLVDGLWDEVLATDAYDQYLYLMQVFFDE